MLFFGSFGSMFPYLIYLSIVWVCVLVGMRGNFGMLFKHSNSTQLVISSHAKPAVDDVTTLPLFSDDMNVADSEQGETSCSKNHFKPPINAYAHWNHMFKHSNAQAVNRNVSRRGPPLHSC